jgi:hypothetical protein
MSLLEILTIAVVLLCCIYVSYTYYIIQVYHEKAIL